MNVYCLLFLQAETLYPGRTILYYCTINASFEFPFKAFILEYLVAIFVIISRKYFANKNN